MKRKFSLLTFVVLYFLPVTICLLHIGLFIAFSFFEPLKDQVGKQGEAARDGRYKGENTDTGEVYAVVNEKTGIKQTGGEDAGEVCGGCAAEHYETPETVGITGIVEEEKPGFSYAFF